MCRRRNIEKLTTVKEITLTVTTAKVTIKYVLLALLLVATCLEIEANDSCRINIFDKKLYQAISEENLNDKLTNLILSPVSVEILLAVAGLGASGNTKNQISTGIGLSLELSSLRSRFYPITFGIKSDEGFILRIISQILVEQTFPLRENFVNSSAEGFNCGLQSVGFNSNPDSAVYLINTWVENQTEGLIKNLVDSSVVTPSTKVIFINAIYFKGKWTMPFNPKSTSKRKFQLEDGKKVSVNMMYGEIRTKYAHSRKLNAKVLELPYKGNQLSMVILLPDRTSSIAELETRISTDSFDFNDLISNRMHLHKVDVFLPKFKVELKTNLKSSLLKLGISDMFTDQADFSGMTYSKQGLKVSKVLHKAYIEVSEEGTEAAAATDMEFTLRSGRYAKYFKANRHFIFLLLHKESGKLLFIGRVADPSG